MFDFLHHNIKYPLVATRFNQGEGGDKILCISHINSIFEKQFSVNQSNVVGRNLNNYLGVDDEELYRKIFHSEKISTSTQFEISSEEYVFSIHVYRCSIHAFILSINNMESLKETGKATARQRAENSFECFADKPGECFVPHLPCFRIAEKDYKLLGCNEQFAQLFGYSLNSKGMGELQLQNYLIAPCNIEDLFGLNATEPVSQPVNLKLQTPEKKLYWMNLYFTHHAQEGLIDGTLVDVSSFKEASHGLAEHNQALSAQVDALKEEQEKIHRQNGSLLKLKVKMEETNRNKSLFLSGIMHDLRTPINGILGFSTLLKPGISEDKFIAYKQIIKRCSKQVSVLISDFLDLSKMELDALIIRKENFYLNAFLSEIQSEYITQVQDKPVSIKLVVAEQDILINSDRMRLRQVFNNLLNNALNFTHRGTISFGYKIQEGQYIFFVSDTGAGIPREEQEHIFEPFITKNVSEAGTNSGTGLGLMLVKSIITNMAGKIWMDSVPGSGSNFYFVLQNLFLNKDTIRSAPIPAKISHVRLNPLLRGTVLVAEDSQTTRALFSAFLAKSQLKIIEAKDGEEAVQAVKDNPEILLVLLDIRMPKIDGFEALKAIRKTKPGLPVIAHTAYFFASETTKLKTAGFEAIIKKPIERLELYKLLEKYLPEAKK